jgi:hypothetical protein
MAFSIILFLALTALSAHFTVRAVGILGAGELNPAMRLLVRIPWAFWLAQGLLAAAAIFFMLKFGPWFVSLAISVRSITAYNDWLVYKGKLK